MLQLLKHYQLAGTDVDGSHLADRDSLSSDRSSISAHSLDANENDGITKDYCNNSDPWNSDVREDTGITHGEAADLEWFPSFIDAAPLALTDGNNDVLLTPASPAPSTATPRCASELSLRHDDFPDTTPPSRGPPEITSRIDQPYYDDDRDDGDQGSRLDAKALVHWLAHHFNEQPTRQSTARNHADREEENKRRHVHRKQEIQGDDEDENDQQLILLLIRDTAASPTVTVNPNVIDLGHVDDSVVTSAAAPRDAAGADRPVLADWAAAWSVRDDPSLFARFQWRKGLKPEGGEGGAKDGQDPN